MLINYWCHVWEIQECKQKNETTEKKKIEHWTTLPTQHLWIPNFSKYKYFRSGAITSCTKAAPEVMSPIFIMLTHEIRGRCLYGSKGWTFPSVPHYILVTGGSRGAVWHSSVWHGSIHEAKVWNRFSPCEKKKKSTTHWHSLMLA